VSTEEAFRLLDAISVPDYATRATETHVAAGVLKHAIDPSGRRLLLVPLADDDHEVEDVASKGVTVETGPFMEGASTSRCIFVRCDDNSLVDLFSTVCDEIIEGCATMPDQAGSVVIRVLERWRELLGPSRGTLLGSSEIKGLLAELHLMEELAVESPSKALERWTGSDKTRHDFSGPSLAIEVKASAMVDEVRVRIHGLAQLVAPTNGRLVLLVERLESVPGGGDALPDAVSRLIEAGVDENGLLRKIKAAGAHVSDFKAYSKVRFKTLEKRAYDVGPSFPRLIPAMFTGTPADGRVHGVEYVLDLAAPPPDVMDDSAWSQAMKLLLADAS
jgi:hypothetical protein